MNFVYSCIYFSHLVTEGTVTESPGLLAMAGVKEKEALSLPL